MSSDYDSGAGPESAGSAIGMASARLAWDYSAAMSRAAGDESLVILFLPDQWVTLAAHLAQLIMVEALKQAEAAAFANRGRAELRELCVHCGCEHFAVYADPAGGRARLECSRCHIGAGRV
jgi:hypothetical protein